MTRAYWSPLRRGCRTRYARRPPGLATVDGAEPVVMRQVRCRAINRACGSRANVVPAKAAAQKKTPAGGVPGPLYIRFKEIYAFLLPPPSLLFCFLVNVKFPFLRYLYSDPLPPPPFSLNEIPNIRAKVERNYLLRFSSSFQAHFCFSVFCLFTHKLSVFRSILPFASSSSASNLDPPFSSSLLHQLQPESKKWHGRRT